MLKINLILIIVATIIVTMVGGLVMWQTGAFTVHNKTHTDKLSDNSIVHEVHKNHQMSPITNERDFLLHMIPHHEEAVQSARLILLQGGDNEQVRELAESIINSQSNEISQMKQWLEQWYDEMYATDESYIPMMQGLETLSGAELNKTFLEQMIEHHRSAVFTAQGLQPYITRTEMQDFTELIMTEQSEEIARMRELLTEF